MLLYKSTFEKKILKAGKCKRNCVMSLLFHFKFSNVNNLIAIIGYLSLTNGQGTLRLFKKGIYYSQYTKGTLCSYLNVVEFPSEGFKDESNYQISNSSPIDIGLDFSELHSRLKGIPKNTNSSLSFSMLDGTNAIILQKTYKVKNSKTHSTDEELLPIGNYEIVDMKPSEPTREWDNPNIIISTNDFCTACKDFSSQKNSKTSFKIYDSHFTIVGSTTSEGVDSEYKWKNYGPQNVEMGDPITTVAVDSTLVKSFDKFKGIGDEIRFYSSHGCPIKMVVQVSDFAWLITYIDNI